MKKILMRFSIAAMAMILALGAFSGSKAFAANFGGTNETTKALGTGYIQEFNNMTSSATWTYSMGTCWTYPVNNQIQIDVQNISSTNVQALLYLDRYNPSNGNWEAVAHTGIMTNNGRYDWYSFTHEYSGLPLDNSAKYRFHFVLSSGAATTTSYLYQLY